MAKKAKSPEEIKPVVEALLFASERPLAAAKMARIIEGADARMVRKAVEMLAREYEEQGRAFGVEEIAGGYQLLTRPEFRNWVVKLRTRRGESRISGASLEALAIVAYKQPVLRAEVEAIRGVQSGEVLRGLLEKNLIKVVGRKNTIGRPILYGTTKKFLEQFGLDSLKSLPKMAGAEETPVLAPAAGSQEKEAEQSHEGPGNNEG